MQSDHLYALKISGGYLCTTSHVWNVSSIDESQQYEKTPITIGIISLFLLHWLSLGIC